MPSCTSCNHDPVANTSICASPDSWLSNARPGAGVALSAAGPAVLIQERRSTDWLQWGGPLLQASFSQSHHHQGALLVDPMSVETHWSDVMTSYQLPASRGRGGAAGARTARDCGDSKA
jgi:hypothetical protein